MKKILTMLSVVCLLFSLSACGSNNSKIVGTWRDDPAVGPSHPKNNYTFYDDGTGITGLDYTFTYKLSGDKLYITYDENKDYTASCKIKFAGSDSFSCRFDDEDYGDYVWEMFR